jgi:hypothetical protein
MRGLDFVRVYIDDLLVVSKGSFFDHHGDHPVILE